MSGAHTSSLLSPCAEVGAVILSVHPIQSFASVDQAVVLIPGSYFSIEGDEGGYDFAQEIVKKLKGKHLILQSNSKVLYHAAASIASNYLVGLLSVTLELLDTAGVPNDVGLQAFLPLIEGTLKNVKKLGITGALTGPISRGDLRSILASSPNIRVDYVEVVNGDDLSDLSAIKGKVLLVAAVYVRKTRLIDNIDLEV
jgi:predicted short-subunit dehydrogenase-like oxidoreductase (DUF2520 family)